MSSKYLNLCILSRGYFEDYKYEVNVCPKFPELQIVKNAHISYCCNGEKQILRGNYIWVNLPQHFYNYKPQEEKGWNHKFLEFKTDRYAFWEESALIPAKPIAISDKWCPVFDEYFFNIHKYANSEKPLEQMKALNTLELVLIKAVECDPDHKLNQKEYPLWLKKVLHVLGKSTESPDYEKIAEEVHMGPRNLQRKFKSMLGVSMHMYYLKIKMKRAIEFLREGQLSIKEISAELKYKNYYFFSQQFKQFTGLSPKAFKQRYFVNKSYPYQELDMLN